MSNFSFKIIACLAIAISLYSYLSTDSPKLYNEKQMTTHYVNKRLTIATANLLYKSHLKQCNYDYHQRSQNWKDCVKEGIKKIRNNTLSQIETEH